jgi:hypothetical protein
MGTQDSCGTGNNDSLLLQFDHPYCLTDSVTPTVYGRPMLEYENP